MKPDTLPVRVDMMPRDNASSTALTGALSSESEAREPSAGPLYSFRFLIALALSTIPYRWSGKLKTGGWKIVPMERADYGQH